MIRRYAIAVAFGVALTGCGSNVPHSETDEDVPEEAAGETTGESVPPPPACDPRFDSKLPRGAEIWSRSFSSTGMSWANGLTVSPSGDVVAVGSQDEAPHEHNGWLLHLGPEGHLNWQVVRDAEISMEFEDVTVMPNGDVVASGYEVSDGIRRPQLFRFSPDGELLWVAPVDFGGASPSESRVASSADGRIIVGADVLLPDVSYAVTLREFSADGESRRVFEAPQGDVESPGFSDLGWSDSNTLYAAGKHREDPSTEWVRRWDPQGESLPTLTYEHWGARASEISPLSDGVLVLGTDYAREDAPFIVRPSLRRYDTAGNRQWEVVIDMDIGDDPLMALQLTTDCLGRSWVQASHSPVGGPINRWLFLHDEDGVELDRILVEADNAEHLADIDTDPFGNLVILMHLVAQTDAEFTIRKLAR